MPHREYTFVTDTDSLEALVVRPALRPGWLELVSDASEVAQFLALRGGT